MDMDIRIKKTLNPKSYKEYIISGCHSGKHPCDYTLVEYFLLAASNNLVNEEFEIIGITKKTKDHKLVAYGIFNNKGDK